MRDLTKPTKNEIDSFFVDSDVHSILAMSAETRPLQICYPREVPMTRFLAWLLDPSQGHGLGDWPIRSLLIAAWSNINNSNVALRTQHLITPSNIVNDSFSNCLVDYEMDFGIYGTLDILLIDPSKQIVIAIEHKYGALQGQGQLNRYRQAIEEEFSDKKKWSRVFIFLDERGFEPEDNEWVTVDYSWLSGLLKSAEHFPQVSAASKQCLGQFLSLLQAETDLDGKPDDESSAVMRISIKHASVIGTMAKWASSRKHYKTVFLELREAASISSQHKALFKLFQAYWRRPEVFERCISALGFAPFVKPMKDRYENRLLEDPKKVKIAFSLSDWVDEFADSSSEDFGFPAFVSIRKTSTSSALHDPDALFRVSSFINLESVKDEHRPGFLSAAEQIRRSEKKMNSKIGQSQTDIRVCFRNNLSRANAIKEMMRQIKNLEEVLMKIR